MASHHVNNVHKFAVLIHSVSKAPCADLFSTDYLYLWVVIRGAFFTFEMWGKIFHPFRVSSTLILHSTYIVKFKSICFISGVKGVFIPFVSCSINVGSVRYPLWFTPPKHIQGEVRIYLLCVSGKLVCRTSCYVSLFVLCSHYRRFCAWWWVYIRTHFQLKVSNADTFFAKHILDYLLIYIRVFSLVIQQKPWWVVCAHHACTSVAHIFFELSRSSVNNNLSFIICIAIVHRCSLRTAIVSACAGYHHDQCWHHWRASF